MDTNWKQDPRLKAMSKEKLDLLTEFAERIEHTNKNNLMEAFMSIKKESSSMIRRPPSWSLS